jgi:anti-sigma factor RsiW
MTCNELQEQLKRFLDGALSGAESRGVRIHLAECPACAAHVSLTDRVEALVALDDEIEPSPGLNERFHARLGAHRARSADRWWKWLPVWSAPQTLALAGALALLAGVVVFWRARPTEPVPSVPAPEVAIAESLPLLQDLGVIENLELLEDFDVLQDLSNGTHRPQQ